jgi:hypothetical protein
VLHGHRHLFHTSIESHPAGPFAQNRCHFIGADSMGCKEEAPFLEILLSRKHQLHRNTGPTKVFVREYRYSNPNGFGSGIDRCSFSVGRSTSHELLDAVENRTPANEMTVGAKEAFIGIWPVMRNLHDELVSKVNEYEWVEQFHNQLGIYTRIWATALFGPQSISDSTYQKYLRQQPVHYGPALVRAFTWMPIRSLTALRIRCLQPRYRSVVCTDTCPSRNWIWSSSPPASWHRRAQVRRRSCGASFSIPGFLRILPNYVPDDLLAEPPSPYSARACHSPKDPPSRDPG